MAGHDEEFDPRQQVRQLLGTDLELPVTLVDEWESRTARLYRLRVPARPGGGEFVLKLSPRWTRSQIECIAANSKTLQALPGSDGVVRAVAHDVEHRAILFDYVEGSEMVDALRTDLAAGNQKAVNGMMASAGALLGHIHRCRATIEMHHPATTRICPRLARTTRGRVMSTYDFAIYNLRVSSAGALVLIEPPAGQRIAPVRTDLAWFLVSLDGLRSPTNPIALRSLRKSFIVGYRATLHQGSRWTSLDDMFLRATMLRLRLRRQRGRLGRRRLRRKQGDNTVRHGNRLPRG